jgi:hypothetical protein
VVIERALDVLFLTTVIALLFIVSAQAGPYRHIVALQWDWNTQTGIIVEIGADSPNDDSAAPLKAAFINVGIGNGKSFRWIKTSSSTKWEFGKEYSAKLVIDPDKAELTVNGEKKYTSKGKYVFTDIDLT